MERTSGWFHVYTVFYRSWWGMSIRNEYSIFPFSIITNVKVSDDDNANTILK